jgi:CO/xanthine dehydrogenase FAD-binding subunit
MTVLLPRSVEEAVEAMGSPGAQALAGGTDFMVEVNGGHRRPSTVVALRRVSDLKGWRRDGEWLWLGAGLTYTEMLTADFASAAPALAHAARTVGSPQIRNAGTVGGNLGTASPAGDTLPVLAALSAQVEVVGARGRRSVPFGEFVTGPKRTSLAPGEIVAGVRIPVRRGHQEFRKVGVRNAMVISVASVAFAVDEAAGTVAVGLGSVGPVPLRAPEAEAWLAAQADWSRRSAPVELVEFGRLVAQAARPIDDHRGTAAYRAHAVAVLAQRAAAHMFR